MSWALKNGITIAASSIYLVQVYLEHKYNNRFYQIVNTPKNIYFNIRLSLTNFHDHSIRPNTLTSCLFLNSFVKFVHCSIRKD